VIHIDSSPLWHGRILNGNRDFDDTITPTWRHDRQERHTFIIAMKTLPSDVYGALRRVRSVMYVCGDFGNYVYDTSYVICNRYVVRLLIRATHIYRMYLPGGNSHREKSLTVKEFWIDLYFHCQFRSTRQRQGSKNHQKGVLSYYPRSLTCIVDQVFLPLVLLSCSLYNFVGSNDEYRNGKKW